MLRMIVVSQAIILLLNWQDFLHTLQYKAVDVNNSTITVLDVGTIVSGKQLVAHYIADPPSLSTFLPTALNISLQLNSLLHGLPVRRSIFMISYPDYIIFATSNSATVHILIKAAFVSIITILHHHRSLSSFLLRPSKASLPKALCNI